MVVLFWTIETKLNITYWQDYRFSWVWCPIRGIARKYEPLLAYSSLHQRRYCCRIKILKLHSFWPYPDWFSLKSKQRLRIDFLWNQASFSPRLFYWLYRHSVGETFILEVKTQLLLRKFCLTKSIARAEARATEQNRRQRRTSLRGVRKNCGSTGVEIWWELMGFKGISFGYMMVYPLVV